MILNRISRQLLLVILSLFLAVAIQASPGVLRMATTTSTENSGLIRALIPPFEQQTGIQVHVIAVGTGKALKLGERGDVDIILVHARKAEEQFVTAGFGVKRHEIMYNDFVIVGPVKDPAKIQGLHNAVAAFSKIAKANALFISRGDDSGTHKKEKMIWPETDTLPDSEWYREVGQGMGKTLQIAGEINGYTLTDRGTWLAYRENNPLMLLVEGDKNLKNFYGAIAVNPQHHPDTNIKSAQKLIEWLTSDRGKEIIEEFRIDGEQLFYPISN
ncbi:MAG: substrate-binding domain-containing protein [Thiotrichaceae bacterium]